MEVLCQPMYHPHWVLYVPYSYLNTHRIAASNTQWIVNTKVLHMSQLHYPQQLSPHTFGKDLVL